MIKKPPRGKKARKEGRKKLNTELYTNLESQKMCATLFILLPHLTYTSLTANFGLQKSERMPILHTGVQNYLYSLGPAEDIFL